MPKAHHKLLSSLCTLDVTLPTHCNFFKDVLACESRELLPSAPSYCACRDKANLHTQGGTVSGPGGLASRQAVGVPEGEQHRLAGAAVVPSPAECNGGMSCHHENRGRADMSQLAKQLQYLKGMVNWRGS